MTEKITFGESLHTDMQRALKRRDSVAVSTLRMLLSAIKNQEIAKKVAKLEDADVYQVIQKQIKQRKDSVQQFIQGGRQDLADKETQELKILESYMPALLGSDELIKIIEEAKLATGAVSRKDAGRVMREVMERAKGRADGKLVSQLVMERLT